MEIVDWFNVLIGVVIGLVFLKPTINALIDLVKTIYLIFKNK